MSARTAPDLRTLAGQVDFLDYHAPDEDTRAKHALVNYSVRRLWTEIASTLPDGPGKTRALHALNQARMEMNNCIANKGA